MIKTVIKSAPLKGEITIPADKSISHRAVMLSSIAKGKSIIRNFSSGEDCHTTLNIFKQLGINIDFIDNKTLKIEGGILNAPTSTLYCGNSGTTTRLISGILAGQNFTSTLIGDESLSKRPMKRIIEPLSLMGAKISSEDNRLPMTIEGAPLNGIEYSTQIASAQVKSAILLAGLRAEGKTTVKEPFISRDHTERMLKYLGARLDIKDNEVTIHPSELEAHDINIAGDISSAAFFIVAGLIVKESNFVIKNVGLNPTRTGIIDIVKKMGGNIEIFNEREVSGEPVGDIRVQYSENLKHCVIEGEIIPKLIDELPVIAVLLSQADGESIVKDAQDLRNKEADRITCLVKELSKIGIDIEETPDGFIVRGKTSINGGSELECYHDHRLAMSYYIAGLISKEEIAINGFEWTKISFPEFEELFFKLK